mmetsp:Transcript_27673/g.67330  ORF Transcript_27673/g.67330 Transcript_27673/m.67330 type:complete len:81 (-) Transcript_27673:1232-1474(-)
MAKLEGVCQAVWHHYSTHERDIDAKTRPAEMMNTAILWRLLLAMLLDPLFLFLFVARAMAALQPDIGTPGQIWLERTPPG